MGAAEQRELVRRAVLARRDALSSNDRADYGRLIANRFWTLPDVQAVRVLHFSLSTGSEVPTDGLVAEAKARGMRVVVPVTLTGERRLILADFEGPEGVAPGPFGIRQPRVGVHPPVDVREVDLVVVPGVAFDPQGTRLGWGAGYYDRLLAEARPSTPIVALAFECQMVPAIPIREHDVRVTMIVTERRTIRTGGDHPGSPVSD